MTKQLRRFVQGIQKLQVVPYFVFQNQKIYICLLEGYFRQQILTSVSYYLNGPFMNLKLCMINIKHMARKIYTQTNAQIFRINQSYPITIFRIGLHYNPNPIPIELLSRNRKVQIKKFKNFGFGLNWKCQLNPIKNSTFQY